MIYSLPVRPARSPESIAKSFGAVSTSEKNLDTVGAVVHLNVYIEFLAGDGVLHLHHLFGFLLKVSVVGSEEDSAYQRSYKKYLLW